MMDVTKLTDRELRDLLGRLNIIDFTRNWPYLMYSHPSYGKLEGTATMGLFDELRAEFERRGLEKYNIANL